jgi:uncharacterized membrane-anchored protein YhcB (DUF1043 family)
MSTLAAILFGLVMFGIGGAIGYYLGRLDHSARAARQDEVEKEFDAYRTKVAEHFGKTADQFHAIGIQYRELYEHLAEGSAALCELDGPAGTAPFPPMIAAQDTEAPEAVVESEEDEVAAADIDESESDEAYERDDLVAEAEVTTDAEPVPDEGEAEPGTEAAETDVEQAAEAGSDEETQDEETLSDDIAAEDEASVAADSDDTEEQRDNVEVADGDAADEAEPAADNVVELVPRTETEVAADKKTYS